MVMNIEMISVERNVMFVKVPAPACRLGIEKRFGNRRGRLPETGAPLVGSGVFYDFAKGR
jgi:hypothetical protein